MKSIPKSFQMGAHTIRVHILSQEEMQKRNPGDKPPPWGSFVTGTNEIFVQEVRKGFTKQAQLHTFWHEYFHCLMWNAGRSELFDDESLVDVCGNLMLQAIQSAK